MTPKQLHLEVIIQAWKESLNSTTEIKEHKAKTIKDVLILQIFQTRPEEKSKSFKVVG